MWYISFSQGKIRDLNFIRIKYDYQVVFTVLTFISELFRISGIPILVYQYIIWLSALLIALLAYRHFLERGAIYVWNMESFFI